MKKFILVFVFFTFAVDYSNAQTAVLKPVLGGENVPANTIAERQWWNLLYYNIDITPDYNAKFLTGTNSVTFRVVETGNRMQIDLQEPMTITSVSWKNKLLLFEREENTFFIRFPKKLPKGQKETITIHFEGHPKSTDNAPWSSGWIWTTDKLGRPWMSVACEGTGASIWLPCKNVLYDEPNSGISMSITIPDSLVAVANGRLKKRLTIKTAPQPTPGQL